MLNYSVLYCTVLYCTVLLQVPMLYCIVLYCTVLLPMLARRVHASTFNGNVKLWVWVSPIPKVSRCGLACGTFTQVIWTCVKVCERPYRPFPLEGVWFRLFGL